MLRHEDRVGITIREIEALQWRIANQDVPLPLQFNGTELSVPAAIELACVERHTLAEFNDGVPVRVRLAGCETWALVRSLRWPVCRPGSLVRNNSTVLFALPAAAGSDLWWASRLHELEDALKSHGFAKNLAQALTGAVGEMADNVWQHSQCTATALLGYRVEWRKLTFSVADLGIGILASLRTNPRYQRLTTSMSALKTAILPGVSRFATGGGFGFPSVLRAVADLWGAVRIRSGEAALMLNCRTENRQRHDYYLPNMSGVHVSFSCALDPPKK